MEKETNTKPTNGRYTVKAQINENDPMHDELYGFYFWFETNKVAENFAELLHEKRYLTEGDIASIIGIKSELSNPFKFFCGDRDIWHFDLRTYAEDISERALYTSEIGFVEAAANDQILKQIQQALGD